MNDSRAGRMRNRASLVFAAVLALLVSVLPASAAGAAGWTDGRYLLRYVFWGIRSTLSKSDDWKLFPYRTIDTAQPAFHFTPGAPDSVPATVEYRDGDKIRRVALDELLRSTGTHAFVVVRDDKLLYENYFNGYHRDSLCISRSVAKSFTSALVGIAIDEGFINSVDDPITKYLPELKGRGFDAITIRHLLTMGSGIRFRLIDFPWDEEPLAYFHPYLRELLLSDLTIVEPAGETFHYNDYNTDLVGMILERATRRTPGQYLEEKIWKPIGMEYPARWSIDSIEDGFELMHVALNARAIDFAKFGRLYLNKGNWNGMQIIPQRWVVESTTGDPDDRRSWETYSRWQTIGGYYKYFWWGISRGADDYSFQANGLWGQYVFVSPKAKVVIVRTASDWGISPILWPQIFQYIADHVSVLGAGNSQPVPH